jgi:hypothetical protein
MNMRQIPTALTVLLLATAGAAAQTAPAPVPAPAAAPTPGVAALTKPSPEAIKEATKLTEMIGVNHQAEQLLAIMRNQMIQLVMRSGNKQQADAAKIVDEVLMPDFTAQAGELSQDIIDVWASNFTVADLKGLEAFYNTPLGKKLIATLPAVTQQGMAAGQAWGQRVYKAAIQKHKDDLIARGLKF